MIFIKNNEILEKGRLNQVIGLEYNFVQTHTPACFKHTILLLYDILHQVEFCSFLHILKFLQQEKKHSQTYFLQRMKNQHTDQNLVTRIPDFANLEVKYLKDSYGVCFLLEGPHTRVFSSRCSIMQRKILQFLLCSWTS